MDLLDDIKTAYKANGLRPIQGSFYIRRGNHDFACPLTALAISQGFMRGVMPGFEFEGGAVDAGAVETMDWSVQTFGEVWTTGFLDGFDGKEQIKDDPDYLRGHKLGVEAAMQLLPV
jgi:hypothetical protein